MHLGSSTFSDTQIVNIIVSGLIKIYDDNSWEWDSRNFNYEYKVSQLDPNNYTFDFNEDDLLDDLDILIDYNDIIQYDPSYPQGTYRYTISAKLFYNIEGLRDDYADVYSPEDDPDLYTDEAYANMLVDESKIIDYNREEVN